MLKHFPVNFLINKKNEYNSPESVDGIEVPSTKIDEILLLAYDKKEKTVDGFYDKSLAECKPETIKIRLSFFESEDEINNIFEDDIPLGYCVTPIKIYSF